MTTSSYSNNKLTKKSHNASAFSIRICKKILLNVLKNLQFGELVIREGNESYQFGQVQKDIGKNEINHSSFSGDSLKAEVVITDPKAYKAFITAGSIGGAEAYIDKYWECDDLTSLIQIFAINQSLLDKLERRFSYLQFISSRLSHINNRNNKAGSKRNILAHYDLGNDMYQLFLDDSMMYSSALFKYKDQPLADAQRLKLDTICQKLNLNASDSLLEIGTGWGGLAIHAAQHYGCHVTTTTISEQQYAFAKEKIQRLGLSEKITLLKEDYRDLTGNYDKVVSIEMIEAVGHEYLSTFFTKCNSLLKPKGKLLLQAITIPDQRYDYYRRSVDFIQKYIFPGGCLPSISIMSKHMQEKTDLVISSIDDFGVDYAKTLRHWRDNFNHHHERLHQLGYDEQFIRLWNYYLCYCEGAFKEKQISVIHLVASKLRLTRSVG